MYQVALAVICPIALMLVAIWSIDRHFRRIDGYRPQSDLGLIAEESRFTCHGPAIGRWGDNQIYEFVVEKGQTFEYDRLVRPDYRYRVATNELFVAPGMVYVAR